MLIDTPKSVITIDEVNTEHRDDAFGVDLLTDDIILAVVIPNKSLCNIERVVTAINTQRAKKSGFARFFPESFKGLSKYKPEESLILTMKSPEYSSAEFSINKVIVRKSFTFQEASVCQNDVVLSTFRKYMRQEYKENVGVKELVSTANWKINTAAHEVMQSLDIPMLYHSKGKISCVAGRFQINSPLRDVVSMINMFQFSHYLKTGEILFSRDEIRNFADKREQYFTIQPSPLTDET